MVSGTYTAEPGHLTVPKSSTQKILMGEICWLSIIID